MTGKTLPRLLIAAAMAFFFSAAPAQAGNICERHMVDASVKYGLPLGVLYAVGMTETGRKGSLQPYALNITGRAVFAKDARAALAEFRLARKTGHRLIDLGCMQINHHFHGDKFSSVAEMLDPAKNVDYAARFLKQLHKREGSWTMAVARYHAGPNNNPAQRRYVCAVIRNLIASGFGSWTAESRRFCKGKPASLAQAP